MKYRQQIIDLIDETAKAYTKSTRAAKDTNFSSGCLYEAPDGRQCAVGRLCTNALELERNCGGKSAGDNATLDLMKFKPEYKWIGELPRLIRAKLLNELQEIHDDRANWKDDGLSPLGEQAIERLKGWVG